MILLIIYLLLLLIVYLLQRKLMYLPTRFTSEQQRQLNATNRLKPWPCTLHMHGLISIRPPTHIKGTVLVFHGNAGSAVHRTYFIDALQSLGYRVIIAEYPGYGVRKGKPSEATLVRDGIVAAKLALHEFKAPLFLCGESLGGGVVAGIVAADEVPIKGLLLLTPFDSLANVAQHHYWFFLAKWLILDKYDSVTKFQHFSGPVAVILAKHDEVVPNERTLTLFDNLSEPKKLWCFDNATHNTLPLDRRDSWWREAMQFLDR